MTDCLNICCVLYRHARRKILGLKDSVLSRAVQLPHRDRLQLAPHIFEHKCREMNYLPTWLGVKHEGASPCLLLLWTSHPTQRGKTPLVRSSNKHNASPGGCKLHFSQNKEEKWFFFGWQILSKVLWGAAQLHTAIYRKMMHCDQSPYSPS